jgi:hypothetical protein
LNRPETRIPPDRVKRRPFPIELHYLITPLATAAADEQTLMGRVVQVLHDYAIIGGANIPASVAAQLPPELRVNFEALTLEELTRVWHAEPALRDALQDLINQIKDEYRERRGREATLSELLGTVRFSLAGRPESFLAVPAATIKKLRVEKPA